MAHPRLRARRQLGGQRIELASGGLLQLGGAILAVGGLLHGAAQGLGHELVAEAQTQHRDRRVQQGGVGIVALADAGGRAREDDAGGIFRQHLGGGEATGQDLGKEALAAQAAGNQLRVLRAKVEDGNHG
jgi:hypothetical protein